MTSMVGRTEGFPLSPQQRISWRLSAGDPSSPYGARCSVRIDGALDIEALRGALEDLVEAHEILRTRFHCLDEMTEPLQVVGARAPLVIDVVSTAASDEQARFRAVDDFFEEGGRPDGSEAPLVRMRVVASGPERHTLLIRAPAVCSDRAGLASLVKQLAESVGSDGARTVELPELQYADAAAWLNELLDSPETELGRRHWERQDLSSLWALKLPFEATPGPGKEFRTRKAALDPGLLARVGEVAAKHGVGSEIVVLACWQSLLHRFLGETRLLVAFRTDGRSYEELDQALGPFATFLPLAGELSPELSLGETLVQLQGAIAESTRWGECFDRNRLEREGGQSDRPRFFPFVFDYLQVPDPERQGNLTFTIERLEDCLDGFKVKLQCRLEGDRLVGELHYDSAIYATEDVERLALQLGNLVSDAAKRPDARLGELRVDSGAERAFADGGSPVAGSFEADCIHHLIEARAASTPGAAAVTCKDETISYEELMSRANCLASRLVGLAVGPDVLVGVCCERSVDMVVAILGTLKAGGAYMPLDPALPRARVSAMLETSGAGIVVAQEHLMPNLPSDRARVIGLKENRPERWEPMESDVAPENLAYVLFTSGSTGKPKAVAVEHRQLVSYVRAISVALELPAGCSYATVTTVAADLGNTAIFPALSSGGHLHVIGENLTADPEAFAAYFDRHPVDVLKIVPSHLEALLSCARPERVLPKKRLVLGGEASSWELVERVEKLAPNSVVFNHYGPTEATIGVSVARLTHREPPRPATPPIGRPIPGARLYVLDRFRQTVPLWAPGELHIGGAGVSRGYLNDVVATESKFFHLDEGERTERVYRTGDLVRTIPGGELEFLGRLDEQLKIRGFRVEPGEIEGGVRRHPGVRDVACIAREDHTGDKRIVAYVVAERGVVLDARELRSFLKGELPDYMVPASFVFLDALPLTPNGKLDRRALPPPAESRDPALGEAPKTPWESIVAEVWGELLEADAVGVCDNFYDLGGHSLLAIQVVTALEKRTGLQVSPRELVFHTLRQFAAICELKMSGQSPALEPTP